VILLRSEPRTAQHNSREERGRRELKEDAELGKKSVLEPLPCKRWTVLGGHLEIVDGGEGGEEDANPRLRLPSWCRRTQRSADGAERAAHAAKPGRHDSVGP